MRHGRGEGQRPPEPRFVGSPGGQRRFPRHSAMVPAAAIRERRRINDPQHQYLTSPILRWYCGATVNAPNTASQSSTTSPDQRLRPPPNATMARESSGQSACPGPMPILIIVHYYVNPYRSRIKRAADEYCRDIPERPVVFGNKSGTATIRKQTPVVVHNFSSSNQTPGGQLDDAGGRHNPARSPLGAIALRVG